MSVFQYLTEEHALLLRLVGRLERGSADPDERAAARETRNILLVLLKALESHERLERLVFDPAPKPHELSVAERRALLVVEGQHRMLAELREEAVALLRDGPRDGSAPLRALVLRLATLLRRHFQDEERELWPSFNAHADRSTLGRLDRQVRSHVRAMEGELSRYWAEVADYLTGDR
ncbi:MAG: hemerythrin domain-containing protein [Elusimicrobiota bacterium]